MTIKTCIENAHNSM